jgi:hypothetical protein
MRIHTGLCSCYQCLLSRKGTTPYNKNVPFPSAFRHQSQIPDICLRPSPEKGMPAFDRLMATCKKIQLWHCVTVFVIRDNSTVFILLRTSGASPTMYPLMMDYVGERWRGFFSRNLIGVQKGILCTTTLRRGD